MSVERINGQHARYLHAKLKQQMSELIGTNISESDSYLQLLERSENLMNALKHLDAPSTESFISSVDFNGQFRQAFPFLEVSGPEANIQATEGLGDLVKKIRVYFSERRDNVKKIKVADVANYASELDTAIGLQLKEFESVIGSKTFISQRVHNVLGYFPPAKELLFITEKIASLPDVYKSMTQMAIPTDRSSFDSYINSLNMSLKELYALFGVTLNQYGGRAYWGEASYLINASRRMSLESLGYGDQNFYRKFAEEYRNTTRTTSVVDSFVELYNRIADRRAQLAPSIKTDKMAEAEFYTINRVLSTHYNIATGFIDIMSEYAWYYVLMTVWDIVDYLYEGNRTF